MNTQLLPIVIAPILLAMVITWFVLIKLLFNRLERVHPQKYEAMGRPSLFLRNNIATGLATLKFLLAREHRPLNDGYLSKLSDAMLAFFVVYLLLFFSLVFLINGRQLTAA